MAWANWVGGVWTCALLGVLTAFVGCNGSTSSNSCISYCDNLCSSLEACDVEPKDCRSSCEGELTDKACKGQPAPDRLTCAELTEAVACAEYCTALCDRAPSCGTFDSGACVTGCLEVGPSICNAASVEARSCDQLKPEIRFYESIGSIQDGDGDQSSGGGLGSSYGLCEDADECDEPLGCSQKTNTCAACETNADCERGFGAYLCSEQGECEKVACVEDDDCGTRPCNTELHECGQCREDADCTLSFSAVCDAPTMKCVECNADADCKGRIYPLCDTGNHECVECNADADCNESSPRCDTEAHRCKDCLENADCDDDSPRCDPSSNFCRSCASNDDCKGRDNTICYIGSCVQCANDTDCQDEQECSFQNICE